MLAHAIPDRGFPPVLTHFTTAVGSADEVFLSGGGETYERLNLAAGQTSFHQRVINLIERGQPVDALKQVIKALDKIDNKTSGEIFHRTMTLAIQALQMLEASGDRTVASVLRLNLPAFRLDHDRRYVPANANAPAPSPPRPQ